MKMFSCCIVLILLLSGCSESGETGLKQTPNRYYVPKKKDKDFKKQDERLEEVQKRIKELDKNLNFK